jgi:16S rRNA U1498 N3-methylase RsmE
MLPHSYERIELKITSLTKEELRGICVQEFAHSEQKFPKTLLCALPNKHEKIEQIVQKCTEI